MKYRLAKDFGVFKKDMEFERLGDGLSNYVELNLNDTTNLQIHNDHIKYFLEQGIIEEVSEPKWTDEDMLEFANLYAHYYFSSAKLNCEEYFQQWQEQRK